MQAHEFIYTTLRNNAQVSVLLEGRIYPQIAEQGAVAPYCTYNVVSSIPERCKGETTTDSHRVQVSIFCENYAQLQTITQAVRGALDRITTQTARCDYENAVDLYEAGDLLRHKAIDFKLITNR
jgi:hypothetical protein